MGTSYIEQQVARVNRNLAWVNGSILGSIVAFIALMMLGTSFVANYHARSQADFAAQDTGDIYHQPAALDLSHPARIGVSDVASPERLKQLEGHAVTFADPQAQNLMFPVWDWMARATGKNKPHSSPFYHVSMAQGHPFLILPGNPNLGTTFTGVIRPLTKVDYNVVHPVLMGHGLPDPAPFILDGLSLEGAAENPAAVAARQAQAQAQTDSLRRGWQVSPTMLLVFSLVIGLSGWNVFKAVQRIKNPLTHPIYAKLGRYGSPLELSRAIDAERQAGVVVIAPAEFTRSWLLFPSLFTLEAVPLDEIAWAYKMVTLYNFIPVTFRMVVFDRAGKSHPISAGNGRITELLGYIGQVRPWVALGYSRAVRARFWGDRAAFLAEMDARRPRNVP